MLKYALLGFLNYKPMAGYELESHMSESTNKFWHAGLSQIYMTLKKLEQDGFITSRIEAQEGRPDKRVYTITEQGRKDLLNWLSQPLLEIEPVKVTLLLKLFFSSPVDRETVLTQLRVQRKLHQQELTALQGGMSQQAEELLESQPEMEQERLFWRVVQRFGQQYEAMCISWLDETISYLEQHLKA